MISGIGADIVAVARLRTMWERHGERLLTKLLTPNEISDFERAADKGRFLAKRFAAKEAFAKAFGTGVRPPVLLPSVGVAHDALGRPVLEFFAELADLIVARGLVTHLSISDEADYAIAYVILEQK